jgi:hypothetical protein
LWEDEVKRGIDFWCGAVVATSLLSLYQDSWGGLEGYIDHLQDGHWIDSTVSVPTAIICLLFSLAVFLIGKHE